MLSDAGLGMGCLREPDLKVPAERVRCLLEDSAVKARDDSFGLRMAESRQLSNLGPVGLLLRDQPTVRDLLDVLLRYHRTLNGALSFAVEEAAAGAVLVRLDLVVGEAAVVRQAVELALGVLMRLLQQHLGADWVPRRVCLIHGAPSKLGMHERAFGPRLHFGQELNGIVLGSADLDVRNPRADLAMARYVQQLLDASIGSPASSMRDEVKHAIVMLLPTGRCTIRKVAEHLGVASRTLQRRLSEEGDAFSAVVNDVRASLAARHLANGERSMLQVAEQLGFSEQAGFSRWHREQFGCSPRERRAARLLPPQASA